MGVRRVMGLETEFGVLSPAVHAGVPVDPALLSGRIVHRYATSLGLHAARGSWDYATESPLRDARGWSVSRAGAHASQRTDEAPEDGGDVTLANVVLPNGARLYVDHAHPEYSGPEVTNPRDAVLWDKAGDEIARRTVALLAHDPQLGPINLYKNNTDGKGASYGTHENYLVDRDIPFGDIVRGLTPFLVTRQVFAGAGRVGIGQRSERAGFQLSQRADFFETEVGLETTLKRPIINTRDEPHADADRYRRLHVIIGDATGCDVATLLKVGTLALVVDLVEQGRAPDVRVADPVPALHAVSHDPSLTHRLRLADGRAVTALDVQWMYHEAARARYEDEYAGDDSPAARDTREVLDRWGSVLDALGRDPMELHRQLDWVAKLRVLQAYRDRDGLDWDSPKLRAVDVQWADVRRERGILARLEARGRIDRLVTDAQVSAAVDTPPEDTRAWFRGTCVSRFGSELAAASWDSVVFDIPGRAALQRVPMTDPARGTRAQLGDLVTGAGSAAELLALLTAPGDAR